MSDKNCIQVMFLFHLLFVLWEWVQQQQHQHQLQCTIDMGKEVWFLDIATPSQILFNICDSFE